MQDELLGTASAARYLGVCTKTIDRLRRSKRLPYYRNTATGYTFYARTDLDRIANSRPEADARIVRYEDPAEDPLSGKVGTYHRAESGKKPGRPRKSTATEAVHGLFGAWRRPLGGAA